MSMFERRTPGANNSGANNPSTSNNPVAQAPSSLQPRVTALNADYRSTGASLRELRLKLADTNAAITLAEQDHQDKSSMTVTLALASAKRRAAEVNLPNLESTLATTLSAISAAQSAIDANATDAERQVREAEQKMADLKQAIAEAESNTNQAYNLVADLQSSPSDSTPADPPATSSAPPMDDALIAEAKEGARSMLNDYLTANCPPLKDRDGHEVLLAERRERQGGRVFYTPLDLSSADAELRMAAVVCYRKSGQLVPTEDDRAEVMKQLILMSHQRRRRLW